MADDSPADAAKLLAASAPRSLATDGDRRVHGWTVALLSVTTAATAGLTLAIWNSDLPWRGLINAGAQWALLAVLIGVVFWRQRSIRTWPRHTRRTAVLGVGATGLLCLAVTTPVYLAGLPAPAAWVAVVAATVMAAPGVAAGVLIARGRR